MPSFLLVLLVVCLWASPRGAVRAFQSPLSSRSRPRHERAHLRGTGGDANDAAAEAEQLLAKARAIRESLGTAADQPATSSASSVSNVRQSEFSLPSTQATAANGYRLYLDIGREKGTWMDPRWGASGRRIECTVDVSFDRSEDGSDEVALASGDITSGLAKTVTSKSSTVSKVYQLPTAPFARLRGGFDKMPIIEGGYCIESSASASLSSSSTLRFCLSVAGAKDGDVSIPAGNLFFALPYFGLRIEDNGATRMALSNKEGTITVKQMGWHTGWYREESRILGVFRVVPLEKARERDRF